jgi:hypothetical protein
MMAASYDNCRRMGHSWDELGGPPFETAPIKRDVWLRCVRCSMVRAFNIARNGQTEWPRYFPPEGYYWTGQRGEAPTRADYRLGWLRDIRARRRNV